MLSHFCFLFPLGAAPPREVSVMQNESLKAVLVHRHRVTAGQQKTHFPFRAAHGVGMLTHLVMRRLQNCLVVGVNCWDICLNFGFSA